MQKLFRFLLVWVVAYVINVWVTYTLTEIIKIDFLFSYVIALLISISFNFSMSLAFTFRKTYTSQIFQRYLTTLSVFSICNYLLVIYITQIYADIDKYIVIIAVTTLIFFLKFFTYDTFVFQNKRRW